MKINAEIKITVNWSEEKQANITEFTINGNNTPQEIMTTLELGNNSIDGLLKKIIKQNFENGQCTEKELKKLMKTKFNKLTP